MELIKQLCSLQLAMKLKELKVKQDSFFYWFCSNIHSWHICSKHKIQKVKSIEKEENYQTFSAFSVAELGEMLPDRYLSGKTPLNQYNCWKFSEDFLLIEHYNRYQSYTEADGRAKMLIHVLENI